MKTAKKPDVQKIPTNIGLTSRQIKMLEKVAGEIGITVADFLRRMIDAWMREGAKEL